jgi:uncharacterized phage protein (TIGR02218 family)
MRTGAQAISVLTANNDFAQADLVTLTLPGIGVVYLTTCSSSITNSGHTYQSCGGLGGKSGLQIGNIKWESGTAINSFDMTFAVGPDNPGFAAGHDLLAQAVNGALSGAIVEVHCVIATTFAGFATADQVWLFSGTIVDVESDTGIISTVVQSDLHKLQQEIPYRRFAAACGYTFCGDACGLSSATYTTATTVAADAGNSVLQVKIATSPATHLYKGGTITFTDGELSGVSRTIIDNTGSILSLDVPLPSVPETGDGVSVMQGCAKTLAACTAYSNQTKFPGTPFTPGVYVARKGK